MICTNCGNKKAIRQRFWQGGECCDRCGGLGNLRVPDVYFPGPYVDPNLGHPDRPHERDGVLVTSKQHKARLMKEQGLTEKGDRRGGAINFDKSLHKRFWGKG